MHLISTMKSLKRSLIINSPLRKYGFSLLCTISEEVIQIKQGKFSDKLSEDVLDQVFLKLTPIWRCSWLRLIGAVKSSKSSFKYSLYSAVHGSDFVSLKPHQGRQKEPDHYMSLQSNSPNLTCLKMFGNHLSILRLQTVRV